MKPLTEQQLDVLRSRAKSRDITNLEVDKLIRHIDAITRRGKYKHGNAGYVHHNCRCVICTKARKEYIAQQRARQTLRKFKAT